MNENRAEYHIEGLDSAGKSGDTIHISPLRLRGRGLRLGGWIEGRDHLVRRPAGCDERGKIGKSGDIIHISPLQSGDPCNRGTPYLFFAELIWAANQDISAWLGTEGRMAAIRLFLLTSRLARIKLKLMDVVPSTGSGRRLWPMQFAIPLWLKPMLVHVGLRHAIFFLTYYLPAGCTPLKASVRR